MMFSKYLSNAQYEVLYVYNIIYLMIKFNSYVLCWVTPAVKLALHSCSPRIQPMINIAVPLSQL